MSLPRLAVVCVCANAIQVDDLRSLIVVELVEENEYPYAYD